MAIVPWHAPRTLRDGHRERGTVRALSAMAIAQRDRSPISQLARQHEVNLLRGQAKNASSELEFNDWSLRQPFDSERAEYIKSGIRERIRQSSVTLVYVSEVTHLSRWVDWEIRETVKMGKRVIAMHKGDRPPSKVPAALTEHGIRPVPWTHGALMAALSHD